MTLFDAVNTVEDGTDDHDEFVEACQVIYDTGAWLTLQGCYGRMIQSMIDNGEINV